MISDVDPSEVVLTVAGNEATPQSTTESSITFYVPTAGQVSVTVGGSPLVSFTVSANDISPLTGAATIYQTNSDGTSSTNQHDYTGVGLFESVTFPFNPSLTSNPIVKAILTKTGGTAVTVDDFSTVNGSVTISSGSSSAGTVNVFVNIQDTGTVRVFFHGVELFNFEA